MASAGTALDGAGRRGPERSRRQRSPGRTGSQVKVEVTYFVDTLLGQRVDGLVLATVSRDDELVGYCIERGVAVVLVNRAEERDRAPSVVSDDELGMKLAVDHLIGLGHRKIGQIAGPFSTSTGERRRTGFLKAVAEHGLVGEVKEAAGYSRDAGAAAGRRLLETRSDLSAIVAANDLLALGLYDALSQKGLICPKDISVVGHNDMPLMDMVTPPLTTVRIEHRAMGREAASLLVEMLDRGEQTIRHVVLEPHLVVRGSTTPRP